MFKFVKEAYKIVAARKRQISGLATHPALFKKLFEIRKHIYSTVVPLSAKCAVTPEPVPFGERLTLDYKPISYGEKWGGLFECSWFNFTAKIEDDVKFENLYLLLDIGAEGCVFDDNGAPVKGLSGTLSFMDFMSSVQGKHLYKLPDDRKSLDIWVEGGNNGLMGKDTGMAKLKKAEVVLRNEILYKLYYDYLTLHILMITVDKNSQRYRDILKGLKTANSMLENYSDEEAAKVQAVLTPLLEEKSDIDFEIYATGHSHLDLAWLWPIRETKRKAGRTFSNQLDLIDNHNDYIYGASQPQQFEWTKQNYPALYERIKKAVKDGNFEAQGGMWVEADTNITGG
ncbi:MAG TPA: alpha-mannosidase, partial [Clostridia bacterium]|nr:alpha-mannosidase [Clostridia bacterium]